MTRRLPAALAAAIAITTIVTAPTASAAPVPTTLHASGRAMCVVVDGLSDAVCLDYPGVFDVVGGLIP